jgi:heptosyltransferase I
MIPAKKICIIRFSALGDVVHASAFVNGLRHGYPDAHLTWILGPLTYDLVKEQNNVDRFLIFDRKGGKAAWKSLARDLKNEHFDLVIMLQVSIRASLVSTLIQGDIKLGFDFARARELQWLFSNKKIPAAPPGHVLEQFFEFLDYLGVKGYPLEYNFNFTREELEYRKSFFNSIKQPVASFIIASSNRQKDWNSRGHAEVMDYIDRKLNIQPMIIGGPSMHEKKMAEEISRLCKCKPIIALEKPVRNTLLQLSGSDLVIGPDTGPTHMAIALNVPTISLYGYTDPRRCGPYKRYMDLLIDKYNSTNGKKKKITRKTKKGRTRQISADEIIEKIEYAIETYKITPFSASRNSKA